MFDFKKFEQDLKFNIPLSSKVYKQYATEIEQYLLEMKTFPQEIFHLYLQLLNSREQLKIHGIYQFFRQLYFDFDKLSEVQKNQLKEKIIQILNLPLEHNLEHWLSEIIQNKYEIY